MYNLVRLHSAIGYLAPKDKLDGKEKEIFDRRDLKLAEAREQRKQMRQQQTDQAATGTASSTRPAIDFAAVRQTLTIAAVLQLLGFQPRTCRNGQQRGACPLHGSTSGTSRCFSANLNDHTFRCFKCQRSGNALDLWATAQGLPPYDAAVDLCQRLGIPVPTLNPSPPTGNREEETVALDSPTCTIA